MEQGHPARSPSAAGSQCAGAPLWAERLSSNSRSPPVLRLAITRPGVTSPRSHSIQEASSLFASGAGTSTAARLPLTGLGPTALTASAPVPLSSRYRGLSRHAGPRAAPGRQHCSPGYRPASGRWWRGRWWCCCGRPESVSSERQSSGAAVVGAARVVGAPAVVEAVFGFGALADDVDRGAEVHLDVTLCEGRVHLQHDRSREVLHHVEGLSDVARAVVDECFGDVRRDLAGRFIGHLEPVSRKRLPGDNERRRSFRRC